MRRLGARAVFATHLHELAADVAALNASTAGESRIVSLVASRTEAGDNGPRRSYKIIPVHPWGAVMPARLRRNTVLAMTSSPPCCSSVGC